MKQAGEYLAASNCAAAAAVLRKAWSDAQSLFGPADPRTLNALGGLIDAYRRNGQEDELKKALAQLKAIDGTSAEYHRVLGVALRGTGDWGGAEAAFETAISLEPRAAGNYMQLGGLYQRMGKASLAAEWYEKGFAMNPEDYGIGMALAKCYMDLGRAREALALDAELTKMCPQCMGTFVNMGYAAMMEGESAKALEAFRKASAVAPRDAEPQHHLGMFYLAAGKYPEAEASFKRALEIMETSEKPDPGVMMHTIISLSMVYSAAGEEGKLREVYERSKELSRQAPKQFEVLHYTGQIAASLKLWEEARSFYEQALCNINAENVLLEGDVLREIACTYAAMGDYVKAGETCQRLRNRVEYLERRGKLDEASRKALRAFEDSCSKCPAH